MNAARLAGALVGATALLAVPPLFSPWLQDLAMRITILAIFALSLELLVGMAGLVSLGHAAFFGIGAYATVLAAGDSGGSVARVLPLALLASGLAALAIGALSLRTRGVYFIMVTLAFAQMAFHVIHDTKLAGGSDGIFLLAKPSLGAWSFDDRRVLQAATALGLIGTWALLALIRRSRFGHALAGIRVNEARMRAAGHRTYALRLGAFVIAGMLAGFAGFLLAVKDGAVNPELLAWNESGSVLLMLILGGIGRLSGAVLGAIVFTLLKEFYQYEPLLGPLAGHWQLTLGLTIIAAVAMLPDGLIGLRIRRRETPPDEDVGDEAARIDVLDPYAATPAAGSGRG